MGGIHNYLYVDDVSTGADMTEEVAELYHKKRKICFKKHQ